MASINNIKLDACSTSPQYAAELENIQKELNSHTFEDAPRGYRLINNNLVHNSALIHWDHGEIGENNIFGPFTVIGTSPQHKTAGTDGIISIGDNNIFREFFSIQTPIDPDRQTIVGSRNYLMSNTTIHHDCHIEDDTIICSGVNLAGFVTVMMGSYVGMGSAVHQYQTLGSYSLLGMNTCVIKGSQILPGRKYAGTPARDIGNNSIGLTRAKVNKQLLRKEFSRYKTQMLQQP